MGTDGSAATVSGVTLGAGCSVVAGSAIAPVDSWSAAALDAGGGGLGVGAALGAGTALGAGSGTADARDADAMTSTITATTSNFQSADLRTKFFR
jgi:hypothetical protein